jgi:hypothetical protein
VALQGDQLDQSRSEISMGDGWLLAKLWEMDWLSCREYCKENPMYGFLFWELLGLSPNFHIHVSVSDLYISRIGPHISLQQNWQTDPGSIYISHRYMSVGTGRQNINNFVLKIRVAFLGMHKWQPDIYIGFAPALHLQWDRWLS